MLGQGQRSWSPDIERFRLLARRGLKLWEGGRLGDAISLLVEADGLFDAHGFQGTRGSNAALDEEMRLLHGQIMQALVALAISRGDHDAEIRYLLRLAQADMRAPGPFFELARTAAESGRHGEARRYFRIYVDRTKKLGGDAAPFPGPGRA